MKHVILYFLLVFVAFGCSTDKDGAAISPDTPKREINYVLSGDFGTVSKSALSSQSNNLDTLKKYVQEIEYRCYDVDGKLVSKETQRASNEYFGIIKDELVDGEYDIVFYASSRTTGSFGDDNGENSRETLNFATYNTYNPNGSMHAATRAIDCFTYKSKIIVKEGYVPPSIELQRITGRLDVQISDNIPQSVTELRVIVNTHDRYYPFNAKNEIKSRINTIDITDRSRKSYSVYIMPLPDSVLTTDVQLEARNSSESVIGEKKISGVEIRPNYRTILTGALFTPNENSSSFTVSVDTTNTGIYDEVQF